MKVKGLRMDSSGFGRAEQPADGAGHRRWRSLCPVQRARVDGFAGISAEPDRHRLAGALVAG